MPQKRLSRPRTLSSILLLALVLKAGCERAVEPNDFSFEFEKYTLVNGLEVVLHEDRSDPVVSITVYYHVGGNRNPKGKQGLAHYVEHMMFGPSQNAGADGRQQIYLAGGSSGGGTSVDVTGYQTVVPSNALELVLWLEADRMGFLQPETTQESFAREINLISNEVRQARNRPYAFHGWIRRPLLLPEDHPYQRTGNSFRDISQFTVEDVLEFHREWYGPNNATLLVAGDFDLAQTKRWIEKYFGEIESGPPPKDLEPYPLTLESLKLAYNEDELAPAPQLSVSFPTVEQYHPDWYALRYLAEFLASEKRGPLYQVMVEEQGLAPSVTTNQTRYEFAGWFEIRLRAFPEVDLDSVRSAIDEGLRRFAAEALSRADVERIRAGIETRFFDYYSGLSGKSEQLAEYNAQTGSPAFVTEQLSAEMKVNREGILRVFEKYIEGKPYVMVSTVPKGKADLAVEGSELVTVVDEPVDPPAWAVERFSEDVVLETIPPSFDRTVPPPIGPHPRFRLPPIWKDTLSNGLRILGIENHETPVVRFSLTMKGGQWLDGLERAGVANLLANLMMEGTRGRSPGELRDAFEALGVNLSVDASRESISIRGTCLASRLGDVALLLKEILLEPRWDEAAFLTLKQQTIEAADQEESYPLAVAQRVFDRMVYGEDHVFGNPATGTAETLAAITLDDLRAYHDRNVSPSIAYLAVVGGISRETAIETFRILEQGWERKDVVFPEYPPPPAIEKSTVFFVDLPGSRQSVIRFGGPAMPATDSDYYPATFANGVLDGGLKDELAYKRGYAYPRGVGSTLNAQLRSGTFEAYAQVQSNLTLESFRVIRDAIDLRRNDLPLEVFETQKDMLVKSSAVSFEQLGNKLSMLEDIGSYGLPDDYLQQREDLLRNLTKEEFQELAQAHIDPDRMIYVVVGDAANQLDPLRELGFGDPVLVRPGGW